ncbi:MAG: 16S rRNA (adenine(1518)-N(6)/adenine(1519)-N(6))-dimethyltransferase RsmA [Actinobacteria bacterium HGW-Actinobacteria-7]|jgi:16S rRNA (adenine1518-N6/adenine1519-N6)-dimethyltransferase|nr:MAG: 16S rRNA (adenine(1518)-N(6)/adenine(1519)-N(6))-dimethyltransferase RsmA [Actinobacteria bacterium HGW-Actinobacteria-7]
MGSPHRHDNHPRLIVTTSYLATPRATLDVLRRHELHTKKHLGQHFLVDDNVVGRIIELAALDPSQTVLEVGPGIGTLTVALCDAAGAVVAVERDERLEPVLIDTTRACERFALVHADATTVSAQEIAAPFGAPTAMVANLPYQVAATVVLRFFEMLPQLEQTTVMVQSEVADRMTAGPNTKAYGSYTVKLRLLAQAAGRFQVARGCFLPPPRVDSSVVRLERMEAAEDLTLLREAARLADAGFAQRRKTIRNSMRAMLTVSDDSLDAAFADAGIDGMRRAETFHPGTFIDLARAFRSQT